MRLRRSSAGRLSTPVNVRLRRRQVGVDVVDAVDVLVVEELDRAGDAAGQPLIDGDVGAPDLRELEVGIGDVQLEARRAAPVTFAGL